MPVWVWLWRGEGGANPGVGFVRGEGEWVQHSVGVVSEEKGLDHQSGWGLGGDRAGPTQCVRRLRGWAKHSVGMV